MALFVTLVQGLSVMSAAEVGPRLCTLQVGRSGIRPVPLYPPTLQHPTARGERVGRRFHSLCPPLLPDPIRGPCPRHAPEARHHERHPPGEGLHRGPWARQHFIASMRSASPPPTPLLKPTPPHLLRGGGAGSNSSASHEPAPRLFSSLKTPPSTSTKHYMFDGRRLASPGLV